MKLLPKALLCSVEGSPITIAPLQALQLAIRKVPALDTMKQIASAAERGTAANNLRMFILKSNNGGRLISLERGDSARLGSFEVAIEKAHRAVYFKRSTSLIEQTLSNQSNRNVLQFESYTRRERHLSRHRRSTCPCEWGSSAVLRNRTGKCVKSAPTQFRTCSSSRDLSPSWLTAVHFVA